jgi:UDP-N-acetylmuramoylalanine--D-glutamate ligase
MTESRDTILDFDQVRALIVGLAREGTALARFMAERGARVVVTDTKPADALAENMATLAEWPITYALGGHPPTVLDGADIVFVSPGVPLEIPLLAEARTRELPLSSETRLFTRLCPAAVIGITGSSGKTTTTALVGEMLKASGWKTWVGGNIGQPLIGDLAAIAASDGVVMELSSFQLEFFGPWSQGLAERADEGESVGALFDRTGWSPPIAGLLNITPNHLDRHHTMENYVAAKAHILSHQRPGETAVLNLDNPATRALGERLPREQRVIWFSLEKEMAEGAFLRGDRLTLRLAGLEITVCRTDELGLLGQHNLANALAACALAGAAGAPGEALRHVATTFEGIEHRLELVRARAGVRWYNDSIATTPERTIAALRAFDAPIILIAGGRDKHLPWEEMAALTWKKVRHLVLFGEAAALIEQAMSSSRFSQPNSCQVYLAGTLERAVESAAQVSRPGDVVLLSPGGTSYDAYQDFAERGNRFEQLVKDLE